MKAGDTAPDFELPDQDGKTRKLSELLTNGPVVLFFYPAAMTTGCTKESCHFRDLKSEFAKLGAQIVGISKDDVSKQGQFDNKHSFGYPLLSDPELKVAEAFGVKRKMMAFLIPVQRATFVINTDRTIREVIKSEVNMGTHADKALVALAA
jgi:thioredoxin-dependent peroxiredoxin